MGGLGLRGVVRCGYKTVTTTPDTEKKRPEDLVKRNFKATAPNGLWLADITYVWTWECFANTAFVTDVFARYFVGWRVGTTLATDLALDALEMAIWTRRGQSLEHLVYRSDAGEQYLSIVYTERLEEADVAPSVGTVDVAEINSMMVVSGRPRQLMVMKLKSRCSIVFHFEVPGG
jgi:putative transposase